MPRDSTNGNGNGNGSGTGSETPHLPNKLYAELARHFNRQANKTLADGDFQYQAHAQVDYIYDGDTWFGRHKPDPTLTVATDSNLRDDESDTDGQYYRLSGVDTHELNASSEDEQEMAREEKAWVEDWLADGRDGYDGNWPFILIYGSGETRGSFGRRLCDLVRKTDGGQLSDDLLAAFPDRDIAYKSSEAVAKAYNTNTSPATPVVPWAPRRDALPR